MADIEQVINNLEPLIRDYGVVAVAVVPGPEPKLAFKGAAVASACYSAIRIYSSHCSQRPSWWRAQRLILSGFKGVTRARLNKHA